MKLHKIISLLLVTAMVLSCAPAFAEDFSDIGPYTFADVERPKVVTFATKTDIPVALADRVTRIYPEGKFKAAVFSFDDGGSTWSSTGDYNVLVPALRANNLTSAFNLNRKSGEASASILIGFDYTTNQPIYSGAFPANSYPQRVLDLYAPYEVGNHTTEHPTVTNLSKANFKTAVGGSKFLYENAFNRDVGGFIFPGGSNGVETDRPSSAWITEYFKYTGHRYSRNAPLKSPGGAGRADQLSFDVPTSFYGWNPTLDVTADVLKSSSGQEVDAVFQYYVDMDPNNTLKLFFGWGHGNTVVNTVWSPSVTWSKKGHTPSLENGFRILGEHLDTVWNPTPLQYVDYMNAVWNTTLSEDGNGNITAKNPSGAIDVWLKIYGQNITIPAGTAVTVDASGGIIATKDVQIVYGMPTPTYIYEPNDNPQAVMNPSRMVDVVGTLAPSLKGNDITMLMVTTNADLENLTDAQIGYIAQSKIADDGTYEFHFRFNGFTFDDEGKVNNYRMLIKYGDEDVTASVIDSSVNRIVIKYAWDVTTADDVAKAILSIDNSVGIQNASYKMILGCYTADNRLLGVKISDPTDIFTGLANNTLTLHIPQGTAKVKAFVLDGLERIIPLANSKDINN